MIVKEDDLKGITVGETTPLVTYLKKKEHFEENKSYTEIDPISHYHKPILRHAEETSRVSKRCRHLTREEIEKEYGMKIAPSNVPGLPFNSIMENTFSVIKRLTLNNHRPNCKEIAETLKCKVQSVGSILSIIGDKPAFKHFLDREMVSGEWRYRWLDQKVSEQDGAAIYRQILKEMKHKRTPKTATPPSINIKKAVKDVVEKTLGVKVEISGSIEIKILVGGGA